MASWPGAFSAAISLREVEIPQYFNKTTSLPERTLYRAAFHMVISEDKVSLFGLFLPLLRITTSRLSFLGNVFALQTCAAHNLAVVFSPTDYIFCVEQGFRRSNLTDTFINILLLQVRALNRYFLVNTYD